MGQPYLNVIARTHDSPESAAQSLAENNGHITAQQPVASSFTTRFPEPEQVHEEDNLIRQRVAGDAISYYLFSFACAQPVRL